MRTWLIYEMIYPIIGEPFKEYVGKVDARTETSALNKARKAFKVDRGGVPVRYRRAENFTANGLPY